MDKSMEKIGERAAEQLRVLTLSNDGTTGKLGKRKVRPPKMGAK